VDEFPVALAFLENRKSSVTDEVSVKIKLEDILEKGFKELSGERRSTIANPGPQNNHAPDVNLFLTAYCFCLPAYSSLTDSSVSGNH